MPVVKALERAMYKSSRSHGLPASSLLVRTVRLEWSGEPLAIVSVFVEDAKTWDARRVNQEVNPRQPTARRSSCSTTWWQMKESTTGLPAGALVEVASVLTSAEHQGGIIPIFSNPTTKQPSQICRSLPNRPPIEICGDDGSDDDSTGSQPRRSDMVDPIRRV